jgi:mannose-6-phosphate isomerase-like protein (cupin superfamily)
MAGPIDSGLLRWPEAKVAASDKWGEFRSYFTGETTSMKDLLTGAAVVKPGEEIHAPHKHLEEEFMYLAKGTGTWHLDGKEIPAKEGDVLYCKPWAVHGLKNTGTEPLTFLVVKWNGKGVAE